MSIVLKTPPKKMHTTIGVGGSQPDLSKLSDPSMDMPSNVTQRGKRKWTNDCQCTKELTNMRSEMTRIGSLLEKYVSSNEQMLKNVQENISDIKSQITDLKNTTEQSINGMREKVDGAIAQINEMSLSTTAVRSEQNEMKITMTKLNESITIGHKKIQSLEADVNEIKQSTGTPSSHVRLCEETIKEIHNRNNREKNIILVGLAEPNNSTAEENKSKDEIDVLDIIASVGIDVPKPVSIFRVGKYNPKKARMLKVCFDKQEHAKSLLQHKDKISSHIKIYTDQTPTQKKFLQNLKEDLKRREEKGETGLTIKYRNGTPTIINATQKN